MRPPRTLTAEERAAAARSLRTVGGVYDHVALIVEHDDSVPRSHDLQTTASAQGAGGRDQGSRTGQDTGHRKTSPHGGTSDSAPSARGLARSTSHDSERSADA